MKINTYLSGYFAGISGTLVQQNGALGVLTGDNKFYSFIGYIPGLPPIGSAITVDESKLNLFTGSTTPVTPTPTPPPPPTPTPAPEPLHPYPPPPPPIPTPTPTPTPTPANNETRYQRYAVNQAGIPYNPNDSVSRQLYINAGSGSTIPQYTESNAPLYYQGTSDIMKIFLNTSSGLPGEFNQSGTSASTNQNIISTYF